MRPTCEELLGIAPEPTPLEFDPAELVVDRYMLARVLGIAPSTVNKFAANGELPKCAPGKFRLGEAVQNYIAVRQGRAPAGDKARREKANADMAELKAAQMAGKLLEADEVEREWSAVCRDLRAALLALPSRLGARLPHLGKVDLSTVDSELREALTALGRHDDN